MGTNLGGVACAAALAGMLATTLAGAGADDPGTYGRVRITVANSQADARLSKVRSALAVRFQPENLLQAPSVRLLGVRPRLEDPTRFDATIYDNTKEQGYELVLDADGNELSRRPSESQPEISTEEVQEAMALVRSSDRWSASIASGASFVYESMPAFTIDPDGRRLINVGVMSRPAGGWNAVENEIVSVHLPTGQVLRNATGAPPTALAGLAVCGPSNQSCLASSGSCSTIYHFEWPSVDPVWKFDALHPSCTTSVQGDGTGIELRNVKYRDQLVFKTVHVPVLNVQYVGNVCGPYRDWLDDESCFYTAGTPVGSTGFAVSSGTPAPSTFCESGIDDGNFKGVAIHDEGDSLWLMSESAAGWYRYIIEYRMHLDGTFEPILGFGATVNSCTCNQHAHHGYFRFEFALDGSESDPSTGITTLERSVPGTTDQWTPIPTETKLTRPSTGWTDDRLRIRNPVTGTQYTLVPGVHDGSAAGDSYAKGDTWALAYSLNQINDPNSDTSINIDPWLSGEALGAGKRLVLWYRVGYFHDVAGGDLEPCELGNPVLYFRRTCQGQITVSPEATSCSGAVTVTLEDSDLVGTGTQIVLASSSSEPAGEPVTLTETPPGSGKFQGLVTTTAAPPISGDGLVTVANGDSLLIDYDDVDACGTPHVAVQKPLPVDCAAPVITELEAQAVTDTSATIAWITDEPADSEARYGAAPPPASTAGDTGFATTHSVALSGLAACTHYVYAAASRDRAGNEAVDDDAGAFHAFDTLGRLEVFGPDDLESGAGGWTVVTTGGSSWHLSTCESNSASHAWKAGAAGCPSNYAASTDTFLKSASIALGLGVAHRLRFHEYVSTQPGNDLGRVQISTDAAATWTTLAQSTGSSGGWVQRDIDLSAYAGQVVEIRFWFHSDSTSSLEGWYIDDIDVSRAVPCSAAILAGVSTATATCSVGPSDGSIDPGEDVQLALVAENLGLTAATNVSASLEALSPGVFVTRPTASFPDLPAVGGTGGSAPPHFAFTVDRTVDCTAELAFEVHFTADQGQWSAPLGYPVGWGGAATATIPSSTTPRPLPDTTTTNDSIVVSNPGTISDVNVSLDVTHTYDADLDITLISPNGTRIDLTSDNGGSADDYIGTVFDDSAATSITSAAAPFTGSFQPESPLSVLNGQPAAGTWTLEIVDDQSQDSGTLQSWALTIATLDPHSCTICEVPAPGEVIALEWSALDTLQWTPVAEGAWYEVLRGDASRLAPLADSGLDGCVRWTGTATTSGPVLPEIPGESELYWYLVTAWNGGGRGGGGSGAAGPRVIDPDGPCP